MSCLPYYPITLVLPDKAQCDRLLKLIFEHGNNQKKDFFEQE